MSSPPTQSHGTKSYRQAGPFHSTATENKILEDHGRPPRVALVAPRIQHKHGGQEVQADLLLRLWRDDPDLRISYIPTDLALPVFVERVRYLRTMVRFPIYLLTLLSGLREADVVHIFSASFWSFLIATAPAICVARLLGKKVLIHYHSPLGESHLRASFIARSIMQRVDMVVAPSGFLVEAFRKFDVKAQAIPNVVDLSAFSYRARNTVRPLLLCSRNFEARYGVDVVLRAFADVQKAFPEARLYLAGEGPEEGALRRLIAQLNLREVEMPGRVTRENIGRVYDRADIFINAPRIDNMPVSILEAFAAGLPVVTTDAGGIPYIVRHEETGLVSPTEDSKQLAASVIRLLQYPTIARELAQNAYQQSFAYHWNAVRQQWLCLYRELNHPGEPAN
jgi:L-malate glycosyltransferase